MAQQVKNPPSMWETQEMQVSSLGWEDPLEGEMATHSSMLTWKVLQTEEPGGLQPIVLQRVRHDWATKQAVYLKLSPSFLWALIVLVSDQRHWCSQISVLFFRGTSCTSTFWKMVSLFNERFRKYVFKIYSLAALGHSNDTRDLPCITLDSLLQCGSGVGGVLA